ncbi:Long chronological lifespan protein 2 [Diaporthe eres]|uniref:Long chronological lifespan protein 2 n=1 Tax=Diaporthe eres TaxID=83184 RepID=A0ABR1NS78_DIAER
MRQQFLLSLLFALLGTVSAQFNFFEQMFGGQQGAHCENYLCPDTLACVHFPHHCPCAWPSHEDKFELADGQRICVSKGGFKAGEAARKVELARKGLL